MYVILGIRYGRHEHLASDFSVGYGSIFAIRAPIYTSLTSIYRATGVVAHVGRSSFGVVVIAEHSQASQELYHMSPYPPEAIQTTQSGLYNHI